MNSVVTSALAPAGFGKGQAVDKIELGIATQPLALMRQQTPAYEALDYRHASCKFVPATTMLVAMIDPRRRIGRRFAACSLAVAHLTLPGP